MVDLGCAVQLGGDVTMEPMTKQRSLLEAAIAQALAVGLAALWLDAVPRLIGLLYPSLDCLIKSS